MKKALTILALFFSLLASGQEFEKIGQIVANDPDGDSLTWTIMGGNYGNYFRIVENGVLIVSTSVYSVIKTSRTWRLSVKVTDPCGLSSWAYITVTIKPKKKIVKVYQG